MSSLTRFSVSLDADLLARFDERVREEGYPTRSKAVADLIGSFLVRQEWAASSSVAAAIILVYDHHRHGLANRLTHIQHDYCGMIVSSQHIHLDHHNCLEIIVVRGDPARVEALARELQAVKGVAYCNLAAAAIAAHT